MQASAFDPWLREGACEVFLLHSVPATFPTEGRSGYVRGYRILETARPEPAQREQIVAALEAANLRNTGGVRNAVVQLGLRFVHAGEALEILFCPDSFWLFLHWKGKRLLRELPVAINQPLVELLEGVLAAAVPASPTV